jgi:hypothetical protein
MKKSDAGFDVGDDGIEVESSRLVIHLLGADVKTTQVHPTSPLTTADTR